MTFFASAHLETKDPREAEKTADAKLQKQLSKSPAYSAAVEDYVKYAKGLFGTAWS